MLDALERIVSAAAEVGGRLIAVDALDASAQRFYLHRDFQSVAHPNRLKGDDGQKTWTEWAILACNLDTLTIRTA